MPAEKLYVTPKEEIFKRMASEMDLPLEEIEKVVSWSYMKANNAIKEHSEIEASGLGKFLASQAKVKRRISTIEDTLSLPSTEPKRKTELEKELEYVKSKKR